MFESEPYLAGPETGGPLVVGHCGVKILHARMVLRGIGELRQIAPDLRDGGRQRDVDFRCGDRGWKGRGQIEHEINP